MATVGTTHTLATSPGTSDELPNTQTYGIGDIMWSESQAAAKSCTSLRRPRRCHAESNKCCNQQDAETGKYPRVFLTPSLCRPLAAPRVMIVTHAETSCRPPPCLPW
eukprot:5500711-Prymnesium_polylepis.2